MVADRYVIWRFGWQLQINPQTVGAYQLETLNFNTFLPIRSQATIPQRNRYQEP